MLHALGSGFLFGIGLWLSGMANPEKVLGFLDVTGNWDPSLLLVMAGAVSVAFFGFHKKKLVVEKGEIDMPLVAGSLVFGLGWGIAGYCPGPALTALSNLTTEVFVFVAAMVAGGLLARILPSPAGSLAQR